MVVEIEMERLRSFENHPFKVKADSQMIELQESVKKYGMEKDYIRFEEAAMLLDVMDQEMQKLIRTSEYRNLFDVRIFNNKKWISIPYKNYVIKY